LQVNYEMCIYFMVLHALYRVSLLSAPLFEAQMETHGKVKTRV